MWDYWVTADSTSMRLGDDSTGLSILATYSCDTLATSDGGFVNRWHPAFQGGLRIAVGAWDHLYEAAGFGSAFASNMQAGQSIGNAWGNAVMAASSSNHPASVTSGTDSTDCWNRHGMNIADVKNYPRRQDNVGYYCWTQWN
jgi:hypothetical protein